MGYTHYWKFKKNPKEITDGEKKFKSAVRLFKKKLSVLTSKHNIRLGDGLGHNEPVIDGSIVLFNGFADGKTDESYETFCIKFDDPDYEFNFCKTAYRPYDPAVCLALLCFKHVFKNDFQFSSDGITEGSSMDEGWRIAHDIFDCTYIDKCHK